MPPSTLNDVFKEVEKITLFQRIVGQSSFVYSNGKLRVSRRLLTMRLISLGGSSAIFAYTLSLILSELDFGSWYCYMRVTYYTASAYCVLASWYRSNSEVDLLNSSLSRMRAVDLEMLSFGKKIRPTKPSWITILIYNMVTVAYFMKVPTMPTFFNCVQLLILYIPSVLIISIANFVDGIASLLRLRFNAINQHLLRCSRMNVKEAIIDLEKLVVCYDYLSSSSEYIDEYFSVQVGSMLTILFLVSFCEVYTTFILYKDETLSYRVGVLTEKAIWIFIIIILAWRVCHQFAAITTEAAKFTKLLYRFMIKDNTNIILNNSKLKLHIHMKREVVFTAHGFFKLDYSLLHSMIASSTAYLFIILQFNKQQ